MCVKEGDKRKCNPVAGRLGMFVQMQSYVCLSLHDARCLRIRLVIFYIFVIVTYSHDNTKINNEVCLIILSNFPSLWHSVPGLSVPAKDM